MFIFIGGFSACFCPAWATVYIDQSKLWHGTVVYTNVHSLLRNSVRGAITMLSVLQSLDDAYVFLFVYNFL